MILRTPIVTVVIGEGGSGGALGIGVADRVLMLENAYYSVISPEGCAAILWKHRKHAPEAAEALKLNATELLKLGVIDGVVPEPARRRPPRSSRDRQEFEGSHRRRLAELEKIPTDKLVQRVTTSSDKWDGFRSEIF